MISSDGKIRLAMLRKVRDGGGPRSRAEAGYFLDVLEYLDGKGLNLAGETELARLEAAEKMPPLDAIRAMNVGCPPIDEWT